MSVQLSPPSTQSRLEFDAKPGWELFVAIRLLSLLLDVLKHLRQTSGFWGKFWICWYSSLSVVGSINMAKICFMQCIFSLGRLRVTLET